MIELQDIRKPDCTLCKLHRTADAVCQLGFGSKSPTVMVVSKMANSRDWQSDLELELSDMGLDLRKVYFTQAVKCRTFDQDASNADIKTCKTYLEDEIAALQPSYILALGNEALLATIGRSGITKYRGRIYDRPDGIEVIPTVSPSAVKRNPGQRPGYMADLRLFVNRVKGLSNGIPQPNYTVVDTREKLDSLKRALSITTRMGLCFSIASKMRLVVSPSSRSDE